MDETEKPFAVEKAKTGRAKCKKCKQAIDKDTLRIAKLMSNPFSEGKMKAWHHVDCLFDVFSKQRASTKKIDDPDEDIDGWNDLDEDDKFIILDKLKTFGINLPVNRKRTANSTKDEPPVKKLKNKTTPPPLTPLPSSSSQSSSTADTNILDIKNHVKSSNKHDSFREFRRCCADIANVSAYTEKTAIVKRMLTFGPNGDKFNGDIILWCKMLLPMANRRVYNLQNKQLIKLFARMLNENENEMLEDLEQGDIAETIRIFFEKNTKIPASSKSLISLQEVDGFLKRLSLLTKEEDQISHFISIISKCTTNDLKMLIRLIKHDLRINCGPKHILEAIHSEAYDAFKVSNNLEKVLKRFVNKESNSDSDSESSKRISSAKNVLLQLMTPVRPMLAEACTSIEMAMKKCPNGILSEIKYDGERVQIHKKGNEFKMFSRSLKPVVPHKVAHLKDYIPKAFPGGDDLILDSEILMIDTNTGQPLPFGTLGVHKKAEFKDSNVCLFVFDCIYYNGEVLMNKPAKERRKILKKNMKVIENRVMLSEAKEIDNAEDLAEMIADTLKLGLEGLVLKDKESVYEPGKRHWLKIKKDYLCEGAMADSADLVVLGAWYGSGAKGGIMSIFLMGCYDEDQDKWKTVTKVHSGHDDKTLDELQDELNDKMIKIGKNEKLIPSWLKVTKPMLPDFIAKDPKKQPVWEITGAEFTNQGCHTADGISIRFPRVTKIRRDKDWKTATSLKELTVLFKKTADSIDFSKLLGTASSSSTSNNKVKVNKKDVKITSFFNSKVKDDLVNGKDERKKEDSDDENCETACASNETLLSDKINTKSKGTLRDVCVVLSDDFKGEEEKKLKKTLITLGATLRQTCNDITITHIIHNKSDITEDELRKYKTVNAKHVTRSWIDSIVSTSQKQNEYNYIVNVKPVYCQCSCNSLRNNKQ